MTKKKGTEIKTAALEAKTPAAIEPEAPVKQPEHYSASQISTYLRCPMVYFYRYVKGMKRPASGHMHLGTAFHYAQEVNYRQKIDSRKDLKLTQVTDAFAERFDKPTEEIDYQEENPADLKDSGVGLVKVYYEERAIHTQPVKVEEGARFDVPDLNRVILFYIDLIDDKGWIHDSKTASKTPGPDEAEKSLQLTLYSIGYRSMTGKKESGLVLDYAIKTKVPKFVPIEAKPREDWHIERDLNDVREVARGIAAGIFPPCAPGSWLCTAKWCGYYHICREKK